MHPLYINLVANLLCYVQLFFSLAFKYILASLKLSNVLTESQNGVPVLGSCRLIRTMKTSIQKTLQQLDKVMFKKTDTEKTLTIMFTMCIITVGTKLRILCLTKVGEMNPNITQDYYKTIQTDWHDTIVVLSSARKDLQVRSDIRESIFELTNWKLEYGMELYYPMYT